ncbi:hypothetical protein [Saccharopolyspora sp. CA-218241]|uniref:hypothetical protein n=1 Tax=Saccharopolyspora sp. CA-218241 TaxID=3240027 RepID=UPI003D98A2B9
MQTATRAEPQVVTIPRNALGSVHTSRPRPSTPRHSANPEEPPEAGAELEPATPTVLSPVVRPEEAEAPARPVPAVPPIAMLDGEAALAQERERSRARRARVIAGVLEWIGSAIAVLLVVHAVLVVGGANPHNTVAHLTGVLAPPLTALVDDLFQPADPALGLVLNSGSAAVLWLLAGTMLGRLVRKVAT